MSLMRLAWRTCATQALTGTTSIPDVCDSAINAFTMEGGKIETDRPKPFISVYTGTGKLEGNNIEGRSLNQNGSTELLIESGIATAMGQTNDEGEAVILQQPMTDQAFEMILDVTDYEITSALTNPNNSWGQLFLRMIDNLIKVERNGARNAREGVRIAGQQIVIHANLLQDPVRGEEISEDHVLNDFLLMCQSSTFPHVKSVGEKIGNVIAGNSFDYDQFIQKEFGLTKSESVNLLGDNQGIENSINEIEGPHNELKPNGVSIG